MYFTFALHGNTNYITYYCSSKIVKAYANWDAKLSAVWNV